MGVSCQVIFYRTCFVRQKDCYLHPIACKIYSKSYQTLIHISVIKLTSSDYKQTTENFEPQQLFTEREPAGIEVLIHFSSTKRIFIQVLLTDAKTRRTLRQVKQTNLCALINTKGSFNFCIVRKPD